MVAGGALDAEVSERDLEVAASVLREALGTKPEALVVLGSGLAGAGEGVEEASSILFGEIPGLPRAGVKGHGGRIVAGRLEGRPVLVQEGRLHLYEGLSPETVTVPLRLAAHAGVGTVITSNASGGIGREMEPGSILLLTDHLDLMVRSRPGETWVGGGGPRRSVSSVYDRALARVALEQAREMGMPLFCGTYAAVLGPSYETPAEVRVLEKAGADVVGMSTVPEALAARALGMRVLALSVVTNRAAGPRHATLDHQDVLTVGEGVSRTLGELVRRILHQLPA